MRKLTGVYSITNTLNGKLYVGSARYIAQRWQQHKTGLRGGTHHCSYLQRAWNKYGESVFVFAVLEELPPDIGKALLIEREQWYIDDLKPEYNTCRLARSREGVPHDEKARANMRTAQAVWRADPEKEARRLAGLAVARAKPEWLEKQLASRRTPEYRARRSRLSLEQLNRHDLAEYIRENGHAGHAPETRERIAESNRAVRATWTPEQTKRLTDAATAARDNPTTRERMSAAKKGRPSVKRADPTKCAKLLHVWVDGRRECLECRRATDEARRRALGMKPQSERDYKNVSAETRKKISDSLRDESADSKSTRWRRNKQEARLSNDRAS